MIEQLIGQSLGRYRIHSLIGEGGMGSVLRGYDETLQRDVAIKLLAAQFMGQPNFRERFLQEARSAARLRHPGIVQVYDFGQAPGLLYIVMEFIPGDNLHQLLQQLRAEGKQMILGEALYLMNQVSQAVDYAHRNGVLHRDIKPANIMLREQPDENHPYQPILTDLGLAKLAEGGIITAVGTSMGTPAYMSPEQALGETTTAMSDVYSMGVLLFELATGQLPFPAHSITDAIRYHVHQPPPRPSSIRPVLAGPIEDTILQALEKEPEKRFSDAAAFSRTLAGLAAELEREALPAPIAEAVSLLTLYEPSVVVQEKKHRAQMLDQSKTQDRLMVMMRDQTTKTIPLSRDGFTIGRGEENDLVLNQPNVSRNHARIEHDGQQYVVIDLDSTNGVYLNDVKLLARVREPFKPESVLRIGDTWMKLERGRPDLRPGPSYGVPASYPEAVVARSEARSLSGQVAVRIETTQLAINPGESAPVSISILNQGRQVDHFRITVAGIPGDWVRDLPEPVYLMPGEQKEVRFAITPPRSSESAARVHPITVKVSSTAHPEQEAELTLNLTLGTFRAFTADLRPQRQSGVQEALFTVRLQNGGNAPFQVDLEAVDHEDNCTFSFDPPIASVPAGGQQSVKMTVRSKIPLFDDTPRYHQLMVTAKPLQAPDLAVTLHGQWEQRMPAFNLVLRPPEQSSISSADFTVSAQNRTGDPLELELEARAPDARCTFTLEPRTLTLPPGEAKEARLTVTARTALRSAAAETHTFSVIARPPAAPSKVEEAAGEWRQIPPAFSVTLLPQSQSSISAGRFAVRVTNLVEEKLNIQLKISGDDGKCSFQFEPARFSLAPGAAQEAKLTVQARSALPGSSAERHPFTVTAQPEEAPAVTQQAAGEWQQIPPSFKANLRPEFYASRIKATYTLAIQNQSDSELTFQIAGEDDSRALHFSMQPEKVRVPSGSSASADVTVRAAQRLKGKAALDHRFRVTASPVLAPGSAARVQGTWQQLPGGRSAGAFLFLALFAWMIITAGWFFALVYWPAMVEFDLVSLVEGFGGEFFIGLVLLGTVGLIGGLITGIGIRVVEPAFGFRRAILCSLLWGLSLGLIAGLLPPVIDLGALAFIAASAAGGLLTSILVSASGLPLSGTSALIITVGWGAASIPMLMGIYQIGPLLFGAIGGLVLLWRIGRARAQLE